MNAPKPRTPTPQSTLDCIVWIWIALAPWIAILGILLGAIDRPRAQEPSARLETDAAATDALTPETVGSGALLARTPAGWRALDVLATDVRVRTTGAMVRATVRQAFRNDTDTTIEATYVFPLPEGAAVHAMEMRIGERSIVSIVEEREQARQIYAVARNEGRKAALVEQGRPNLFRTAVANINPGETVEVALSFVDEAARDGDTYSVSVPLAYTPRFGPEVFDSRGFEPEASATRASLPRRERRTAFAPQATVEIRIDAGMPIEGVESPTHVLTTHWDGSDLVVAPEGGTVPADRDVVVSWSLAPAPETRASAHVERHADGQYVLVQLLPPDDMLGPDEGLATTTLFVLDVSGSMDGPSIRQAKLALDAALARLRPDDAFDVMTFASEVDALHARFVAATPDNVRNARDHVEGLVARGGTHILAALQSAVDHPWRDDPDRIRRIVFLTDGAVSNERAILGDIVDRLGSIRLHTLGIGGAPNRWLLREMARRGRGLCAFIQDPSVVDASMDAFLRRLDRPVLADPALTWAGATPSQTYPSKLPDLHDGEALTVVARFAAGDVLEGLTLDGRTWTGPTSRAIEIPEPIPEPSGVAHRWGRARVDDLLGLLRQGADEDAVRREVVDVALAHGLVTRYTSRVAVETFPTAPGEAASIEVPGAIRLGLPKGGTMRPVARLVGSMVLALGVLLWIVARRTGS